MKNPNPLNCETMNLEQSKENQSLLATSHTDRLSDTAEVVREVSKKIGKVYRSTR